MLDVLETIVVFKHFGFLVFIFVLHIFHLKKQLTMLTL